MSTTLEILPREFIHTFGPDHRHPVTGESLGGCFVRVRATTAMRARSRMIESFGRAWAFQYVSERAAGVEAYKLREIPFMSAAEITEARQIKLVLDLLAELRAPLWVFQAAHAQVPDVNALVDRDLILSADLTGIDVPRVRGAVTRRRNAARKIEDILARFGERARASANG